MSSSLMSASEHPLDGIPTRGLADAGPVSRAFKDAGCATLRDAFEHVWRLPYGRNSDPADPMAPLADQRGTCSTKHALLARLAAEQRFDVELRIGIYRMHESNTPGVGPVLQANGLEAIPEAHCYLVRDNTMIDLTRDTNVGAEPIDTFLHEETIEPDQVGDFKRNLHRGFLQEWASTRDAAGHTPERLWEIREQCIAALSS